MVPRIAFCMALLSCALTPVHAQGPPTALVSMNRLNTGSGNNAALTLHNALSVSANGRYVAFVSDATDLAVNDNNNGSDVFVRDRLSGQTILVSVNAAGTGTANQRSTAPTITSDGRFVVFISPASDLVTDDAASLIHEDVYIRDLQLGVTKLVSRNFAGTARGNGTSGFFDPLGISDDGRYVVFTSTSTDLTATPDNNNQQDVFVRDTQTNTTKLISINQSGTGTGNNVSNLAVITPDGRFVAFTSQARDLIPLDIGFRRQVFVRDLQTNTTKLVTRNRLGTAGGNGDVDPGVERNLAISDDGRFIAYTSDASDMVANDTGSTRDLFVTDTQLETTSLVNINKDGLPPTSGTSGRFAMTPDGRHIAFISGADNLVNNDTNQQQDVFVRDLQTNTTTLISVNQSGNAAGTIGSIDSFFINFFAKLSISNDGRYVSFAISANNLTATPDSNGSLDVFVRDRQTSTTTLVSKNFSGSSSGNGGSSAALITRDGNTIFYYSLASDLVAYDANGFQDLFAYVNVEQPGQVRFKFAATDANENGGSATVSVIRLGPTGSTITVSYSTGNGTAISGTDFTPASGTLVFGPADMEKTFVVSSLNDSTDENDETVILRLSDISGGVPLGEPAIAVVRIVDDDPPPTITISDVSVIEGDDGFTSAIFEVKLSSASAKLVSAIISTEAGTASTSVDFGAGFATANFFPGETLRLGVAFVRGDLAIENTEHFFINITNPSNVVIADGQSVVTIVDDDALLLFTNDSQRAIALNSLTQTAESFSISNDFTVNADRLTRISLFAIGMKLNTGENAAASVTATAEDSQGTVHPLTVEFAADVPGFNWLTQVVVKLNPQITTPGDVKIKINWMGQSSNTVLVALKP